MNGVREGIEKHLDAVRAKFGEEGVAIVNQLWENAEAAREAQFDFTSSSKVSDLGALHVHVTEKHALLLNDADGLANRS